VFVARRGAAEPDAVVRAGHDAVAGDRHRVGEEPVRDGRLGRDVRNASGDRTGPP
jgi:hypothetical protein